MKKINNPEVFFQTDKSSLCSDKSSVVYTVAQLASASWCFTRTKALVCVPAASTKGRQYAPNLRRTRLSFNSKSGAVVLATTLREETKRITKGMDKEGTKKKRLG